MRSKLRKKRLVLCALLGAGLSTAALADDALDKVVTVDIPAQPLGGALSQLAAQSGTPIVAPAGMPAESSAGVHGSMPLRKALTGLLKGSALGFHLAADNSVGIDLPAAAAQPAVPVAAPKAESADAGKSTTALAEIVVTATKREQSVRKIAGTVDVLKGKDLENIGARNMEDFLKYVPGITLQDGGTDNNRTLSIRGIGPQPGANTTVGVLIDDVSMGDPYGSYLVPDLDPFDLHDLEVLKGPQGTLFGASALNGAIRYVLNKPLLGEWEAKGFADFLKIQGAGSGPTFGGAVNIPVGDKFAVRAVDVVQEVPGLYDDVNANGKNIKDADNGYKRMHRLMATWQPLDRLSVNAFYLQQQNHRNDLSIANNLDGQFVRTDTPGPSTSTQHFSVANLDIRYNFDFATLISETSRSTKLQAIDYDTSGLVEALATAGVESVRTAEQVASNAFSQEVRLVSAPGDSPWVWLFGGYLNRQKANLIDNIYVGNTAVLGSLLNGLGLGSLGNLLTPDGQGVSVLYITYSPLEAREESLFGELTRKLFDNRLQLTVGGRFYRENLLANIGVDGLLATYAQGIGYTGGKVERSTGFNPKFSATWQVLDNLLWYATVAHGFQFGGLNEPSPLPEDNTFSQEFKPSTIWSYESGWRLDAFHKKVQFDVTGFLLNWKDMQIQQKTPDGVTSYTDNIGSARSKGVETSFRWLTPIPGLVFSNVLSYIHAKVAAQYITSQNVDIPAGTDLPAAPRLQSATSLSYNRTFGAVRAGSTVTWSHQGHAFSDITHDAVIYRYNTLDCNWSLTLPGVFMAPAFTVNATNLLNSHALIGGQIDHIGNAADGNLGAFNRPRTIALRISGQF